MRVISTSGVSPMSERMAGGLSGKLVLADDKMVMRIAVDGGAPLTTATQHLA